MKLETACAEAEKISKAHKDTEYVVIVSAITKGIERYKVISKNEFIYSAKIYVPIKMYLNGKGEDF